MLILLKVEFLEPNRKYKNYIRKEECTMKKNNNFDAFDKPDDFDEMLFNYFDKKDENIPLSTQNTIKSALKNTHKQQNISFTMLKRIAIFIICFGIIITTTVYAKDIIN